MRRIDSGFKAHEDGKLKKKGFIEMTPIVIVFIIGALVALAVVVGVFVTNLNKNMAIDAAISEAFATKNDVQNWVEKNGKGDGTYRDYEDNALSALGVNPYVLGEKHPVSGSAICSKEKFACKIKYTFSTGQDVNAHDTWSLHIDATEAMDNLDVDEIARYHHGIVRAFVQAGYDVIVNHSAGTTASATGTEVTATALATSGTVNANGRLEIGGLKSW